MTFPEDLRQNNGPIKPPNYALGLVLSVLLAGSGFTYINRWPWHLGWMGILFVLWLISGVFSVAAQSPFLALLLPLLGWVAQLVHYHLTYQQAAARNFRPILNDGIKVALIVGQFLIGFVYVGIMAAVLIPNLLGAREKAIKTGEVATASSIYVQVMADQAEGKPLSKSCPTTFTSSQMTRVTGCQVDLSDPENPAVNVTFESGRTIHWPQE